MLKESIEQLMVIADKRNIDIGFSNTIHYRLKANRSDLHSLFDNIIGNAMLHPPEGSQVDVILHQVANQAVVNIIDNGSGIPASFIDRAFDRFSRSPESQARGSGLGLSIVRSVAQRYSIQVSLTNRLNSQGQLCGLLARVTLP